MLRREIGVTTIKRVMLIAAIAASGLSGLGNPLVRAQETREGIGISPTSLTLDADAGQELTGQVTVLNPGDETINYRLYASNFFIRDESYEKDFDRGDLEVVEPVSWFTLPESTRQLEPQEQEQVTYTIQVPADAASQGYYGVIFAETIAPEADTTGVERRKRVGALVYLTVNGDELRRDGQLVSFDTPRWLRQGPITADLRLRNDGNVHFPVTGEVRLKNALGRVVHTAEVKSIILPDTTRKLAVELPAGQPVGLYKVEGEVGYLDKSSDLGSRWVLVAAPLWLGIWLAGLAAFIVLVIFLGRRRGRRG